jgi:hypothetical protein
MKSFFLLLLLPSVCFSRQMEATYKKDARTAAQKDKIHSSFSAAPSHADLLKALDYAGISIFKFPLQQFSGKYNLEIIVEEFQNGKKIKTDSLYYGTNTYDYFEKTPSGKTRRFFDYLNLLTFYTNDRDNTTTLTFNTYGMAASILLKKKSASESQHYYWAGYSKWPWVVNQPVPLLVFAAAWYDKKINGYRFCGVNDLSRDKKQTEELLKMSPHYFAISYIVSDK